MPDPNLPTSWIVKDNRDGSIVARCRSAKDATDCCDMLDPSRSSQRYTAELIRGAFDDLFARR